MLACDATVRHPGLRNVVYADGTVKSVPEDRFLADIEEPDNANLKAALERVQQQQMNIPWR